MKNVVIVLGRSVPAGSRLAFAKVLGLIVAGTILLISATAFAQIPKVPGIWLSQEREHKLSETNETQLVQDLRRITGWPELSFDASGKLSLGDVSAAQGGAEIARQMLLCALGSGDVFIIEDHGKSSTVTFGQMDEGMHYEDPRVQCQLLIWRVRLDFEDFRNMDASPEVRESFNAGFTVLHELLHGLGYRDAKRYEEIGDCERLVNGAREELGVPLRDQYFAEPFQITQKVFSVRLRFRDAAVRKGLLNKAPRRRLHYVHFLLPYEAKP